jgi:hypothetical protein
MPPSFDLDRLKITKQEIISSLQKFPQNVDHLVTDSLQGINAGADFGGAYGRPSVYDYAAAFANVLSRILKKVISEVAAGSSEGVRDGIKKLVSAVMIGGGATMVWLITSGLNLFPWLAEALAIRKTDHWTVRETP